MNTTLRHIEYLVTRHNCVVVSGFGAILVHRRSACFDAEGRLHAPCSTYAFNSGITESDGLLENSVARALSVSYDRACAIVADDVCAMRRQLAADGSIALGRVGTITLGDDAQMLFTPFETDMLSPLVDWLPVIDPVEAYRRKSAVDVDAVTERIAQRRRGFIASFARVAAACACLVVFALVASTPITVHNAHLASTAPAVSAPRPAFVPSQSAPVLALRAYDRPAVVDTAARSAYRRARAAAVAERPVAQAEPSAAPVRFVSEDHYRVIVGSVASADEARSFIASATKRYGGSYGFIEQNGRVRVYAATGATSAQARAQIGRGHLAHFSGAWVCAL